MKSSLTQKEIFQYARNCRREKTWPRRSRRRRRRRRCQILSSTSAGLYIVLAPILCTHLSQKSTQHLMKIDKKREQRQYILFQREEAQVIAQVPHHHHLPHHSHHHHLHHRHHRPHHHHLPHQHHLQLTIIALIIDHPQQHQHHHSSRQNCHRPHQNLVNNQKHDLITKTMQGLVEELWDLLQGLLASAR